MFEYSCDNCTGKVGYQDWFPIEFNVHWCRTCVGAYFDRLPQSEKPRAARWFYNWWETATAEERADYVNGIINV